MSDDNREYNRVVEYIKDLMTGGQISVGDKLPAERAIAETLAISRNSTREALRVLGNMGMVESRQGSGNYLACDITKSMVDSLKMLLIVRSADQLEMSRFRRYMELAAFNMAFDSNTDIDAGALEHALNSMEHLGAGESAYYDKQFHDTILCASRNQFMTGIMDAFSETCENFVGQVLSRADEDMKKRLSKAHRSLFESVKAKDIALGIQAINAHYDIIDELIKAW